MNNFEMFKPYQASISGLLLCCLLVNITALPSNNWQTANRRPNATATNNQWNYRPAVVATTRNPNQWHQSFPGSTNNNPTQQFPGNNNFGNPSHAAPWAPNSNRSQFQPQPSHGWNTRPTVPPSSNTNNWGSNQQSWNNPAANRPLNQTGGSYPSPSARPAGSANNNLGGWGTGQNAWNKPATPNSNNAWAANNPTGTGTGQSSWNNPQTNPQNPNANSWNRPYNPTGQQNNWNSGQATQGGTPGSSGGWNSPTNPSGQPGTSNSGQSNQGGTPLTPLPGSAAGWNSPANPSGQQGNWNSGSATQGGTPLAPVGGNSPWNSGSPAGNSGWNSGSATQGGTPLAPVGGNSPWNSGNLAGNSGSTAGGAQLAPLSYGQTQPQQPNQPGTGTGSNPYANLFH